jgi:hypothetical protein
MKIIYNQNPLKTVIELTEEEKKAFWLKIKIEELIEIIATIEFHLNENNLEEAKKSSDLKYLLDQEDGIDKLVNVMYERYLSALQDVHIGDCTYVACSCMKCHAEHILNISTIKDLPGSYAYHIENAFIKNNNIDDAIEYLKNYQPIIKEGWEEYEERWELQAKNALKWLLEYKNKHFSA